MRLNSGSYVRLKNKPKKVFEQGPTGVHEWQKGGSPTQRSCLLSQTVPHSSSSQAMKSLFTTSYITQTFTGQAHQLGNERTLTPFTKKTLCPLQTHNLNASIHNSGLFKKCLFSLNFQILLKLYWPTLKSIQNPENIVFSEKTSLLDV